MLAPNLWFKGSAQGVDKLKLINNISPTAYSCDLSEHVPSELTPAIKGLVLALGLEWVLQNCTKIMPVKRLEYLMGDCISPITSKNRMKTRDVLVLNKIFTSLKIIEFRVLAGQV